MIDSSTRIQADTETTRPAASSEYQEATLPLAPQATAEAVRDLIRLGISHQDIQAYLGIDHAVYIRALNRIHLAHH